MHFVYVNLFASRKMADMSPLKVVYILSKLFIILRRPTSTVHMDRILKVPGEDSNHRKVSSGEA